MSRIQFSLGRSLLALGLIAAALVNLDPLVHGCDIPQGILFMAAAMLFCYVAIGVLVSAPITNSTAAPESGWLRCFAPFRRPQFSLKTLLWLMVVVGAFYAGGRRERDLQLTSVGAWLQQVNSQADLNKKLQIENATLRRQIAADHERWLKAPNPATPGLALRLSGQTHDFSGQTGLFRQSPREGGGSLP